MFCYSWKPWFVLVPSLSFLWKVFSPAKREDNCLGSNMFLAFLSLLKKKKFLAFFFLNIFIFIFIIAGIILTCILCFVSKSQVFIH